MSVNVNKQYNDSQSEDILYLFYIYFGAMRFLGGEASQHEATKLETSLHNIESVCNSVQEQNECIYNHSTLKIVKLLLLFVKCASVFAFSVNIVLNPL